MDARDRRAQLTAPGTLLRAKTLVLRRYPQTEKGRCSTKLFRVILLKFDNDGERHHEDPKITAASASLLILAAVPASAQTAVAALKSVDSKDVGAVELTQTPTGVLLKVSVKGLPSGEHAFHVHAVGKCDPPFDSAGGHFNPAGKKHGLMASDGHHAGDMPNLHIPQSGELVVEVLNPAITLEQGKPNSVFGPNGTAIVIHAGVDDYKTDPAGNAGARIACGVIM
jgi:Cu-Zn family superoxide dismutase